MKVAKSSSPLLLTITTGAVAARQGRRGFAEAGRRTQQSAGKLSDPEWIEQELHGKIKNKNEIKQEQIGHHDKLT